jgi:hypothetical protein
MTDKADILWNLYQQHCEWERHHEEQRASGTSILIAIAAGILGLITFDKHINNSDISLTVFLIIQGGFGALLAAKHYERFCMHRQRANKYRDILDTLFPEARIKALRREADKKNDREFPRLHKIRLHNFWIGLHLLIAMFGLILTIGIWLKWFA